MAEGFSIKSYYLPHVLPLGSSMQENLKSIRVSDRSRSSPFSPDDGRPVRFSKRGIWDVYEKIDLSSPFYKLSSVLFPFGAMDIVSSVQESIPIFHRNLLDVLNLPGCRLLLSVSVFLSLVLSPIPALSLWFSGKLLKYVESCVTSRTVDIKFLIQLALGQLICKLASRGLQELKELVDERLKDILARHYSRIYLRILAGLDMPTFDSESQLLQVLLENSNHGLSTIYTVLSVLIDFFYKITQLTSSSAVLYSVLRAQDDSMLVGVLLVLNLTPMLLRRSGPIRIQHGFTGQWVAAATAIDYLRYGGLSNIVRQARYRKEMIVNDLPSIIVDDIEKFNDRIGPEKANLSPHKIQHRGVEPLHHMVLVYLSESAPLVLMAVRSVRDPTTIPVSIASLNLLRTAISQVSGGLFGFSRNIAVIKNACRSLIDREKVFTIQNQIIDGDVPLPMDDEFLSQGVSLEFKNVSFKYPKSEQYALQNLSFQIERGQLCVIVGSNGSGKSTILKLIARLYDTTEGEILVDGRNIRSYKLADLRRTLSVLFQDFELFPLSIGENIGMGKPRFATEELIREAAKLGGADQVLQTLDLEKDLDTYFDPGDGSLGWDILHGPVKKPMKLFGQDVKPIAKSRPNSQGCLRSRPATNLSGGQKQRVALARTFMRTLGDKPSVRCLLFDEPSAAIDPAAEYDLFERLRTLRGNKTMIFSTHRFGNLTRHADLILYLDDKQIIESGTHASLMKQSGQYATLWDLQAQAFL